MTQQDLEKSLQYGNSSSALSVRANSVRRIDETSEDFQPLFYHLGMGGFSIVTFSFAMTAFYLASAYSNDADLTEDCLTNFNCAEWLHETLGNTSSDPIFHKVYATLLFFIAMRLIANAIELGKKYIWDDALIFKMALSFGGATLDLILLPDLLKEANQLYNDSVTVGKLPIETLLTNTETRTDLLTNIKELNDSLATLYCAAAIFICFTSTVPDVFGIFQRLLYPRASDDYRLPIQKMWNLFWEAKPTKEVVRLLSKEPVEAPTDGAATGQEVRKRCC